MSKIKTLLNGIMVVMIFSGCANIAHPDDEHTLSGKVKPHNHLTPLSATDSAGFVSKNIVVKGEVEHVLTLTVDSLRKMKTYTLDTFNVVCMFEGNDSSVAGKKPVNTRTGVLLKDILEKAKIKQLNHKDRNFYIVARAADDYKATFSWAELFNNKTGEHTYVLFEENGKPLKNRGEMILICANDIKTGPRHVIWLKSIEVTRVN